MAILFFHLKPVDSSNPPLGWIPVNRIKTRNKHLNSNRGLDNEELAGFGPTISP